jgi:hypothetical protein
MRWEVLGGMGLYVGGDGDGDIVFDSVHDYLRFYCGFYWYWRFYCDSVI